MKRVLYLGTDPSEFESKRLECEVVHYPVIQIQPRSLDELEIQEAYSDLDRYTHWIFTSKQAVHIFFNHLKEIAAKLPYPEKRCSYIAVGSVTASHLIQRGVINPLVAEEETQEGVIALLKTLDLNQAYLFIPKSSLSRPVLFEFLIQAQIAYRACNIYDTVCQVIHPKPLLEEYDLVVFTSPSTVKAFISIFGKLPPPEKWECIGPVTQAFLRAIPDEELS